MSQPLLVMPVKDGNYVYATECMRMHISPIRKLWEAQWQETEGYRSQFGYDPDEELMFSQQDVGRRFYCSVRYLGEMIGHASFMIGVNSHNRTPCASDDWIYVDKDHRGTGVAKKLMAFAEEALFSFGIKYIVVAAKVTNDGERFFEKNGYKKVAVAMMKERN